MKFFTSNQLHWFFSFLYGIFQGIQGLFFHPYQTVQILVKEKIFSPLLFFPTFCLVIFVGGSLWLQRVYEVSFPTWFLFLRYFVLYFCFFWQGVVSYLFFRFWYAWGRTGTSRKS